MRITWSVPIRGESAVSTRGDVLRARALIDALRADGHEVVVVEDANAPTARATVAAYRNVIRRILPGRIALVLRDLGRVLHARRHARRVAAAARAQRAELLIETQVHFSDSGALAARVVGIPLVLDDCSPPAEEVELGAGLASLAVRIFDRQARIATRIVVPTRRMSEMFARDGLSVEKIRVVPNGVDVEAHEEARRKVIRIDRGHLVIVFVGSFQPWHRADLLVEAFARLPAEVNVHLLLIGDGPGRAPALQRAQRLGCADRIAAPGGLAPNIVVEMLAQCDIGVLPSSAEYCHPMKLLEYAAAGLPAVAPDLAAVREVVEHGVTGLLFSPHDVAELAAALQRLTDDRGLRSALGGAARLRVANHDWKQSARMLLADLPHTTHRSPPGSSEIARTLVAAS